MNATPHESLLIALPIPVCSARRNVARTLITNRERGESIVEEEAELFRSLPGDLHRGNSRITASPSVRKWYTTPPRQKANLEGFDVSTGRLGGISTFVANTTVSRSVGAIVLSSSIESVLVGDQKTEMMKSMALSIQEQFGHIDIYVFDQILRGNIAPGMRVLDAGCGYGRNLVHLLREGYEVFAIDLDAKGVEHVRQLAGSLRGGLPADNFQVGVIERMPFPDGFVDVVICSAVLHFARDEDHFRSMLMELWRVLRPGGMLFCRLGSRIGMEFERAPDGLFVMGDGSKWFLVDKEMLMELTEEMNGMLVDPLKTTIVQDYRCMTTWVLRKRF